MPQRNTLQIALALAVCEGGADHTRWYPPYPSNPKAMPQGIKPPYDPRAPFESLSPEGKGEFVKFLYDKGALIENMPTCILINREAALVDNSFWQDLYVATTGHDVSDEEFLQIGERCVNLERAYIAREGFRRQDDRPPRRMMEEPLPEAGTPAIGDKNMDKMLDDYYTLRGWDPATGVPTAEKLRDLRLDYVIDDLSRLK
jgi:aldehyde:ferredoxin oxidoreductase